MALAKKGSQMDGFDVTVESVIGRVTFSDERGIGPTEAAMVLIGKYIYEEGSALDNYSVFSFPHETGEMLRVTVEFSPPRTPDGKAAA